MRRFRGGIVGGVEDLFNVIVMWRFYTKNEYEEDPTNGLIIQRIVLWESIQCWFDFLRVGRFVYFSRSRFLSLCSLLMMLIWYDDMMRLTFLIKVNNLWVTFWLIKKKNNSDSFLKRVKCLSSFKGFRGNWEHFQT